MSAVLPTPSGRPPKGTHPNALGGKSIPPFAHAYRTADETLFQDLVRAGFRRIVLQTPAGLQRNALELGRTIRERTGADVIHVTRTCFGACDPPAVTEVAGAEALVTLGHAPIPNMPLALPTYFVEMRTSEGDVEALAQKVAEAGLPARLGVVASIQHLDLVGPLTEALGRRGITLRSGEGDARLAYAAQALGCNYTTAERVADEVDGFLFLGTGLFHPLGLAYAVEKPVWSLDPLQTTLAPPLDRDGMVRRRLLTIARVMDARRWGILVSTFGGQNRMAMAQRLRERARSHQREAEILVFDRLESRDLLARDVEAYVSTACPRIALDDGELYDRPILTPPEFLSALGERPLTPYQFDTYH